MKKHIFGRKNTQIYKKRRRLDFSGPNSKNGMKEIVDTENKNLFKMIICN